MCKLIIFIFFFASFTVYAQFIPMSNIPVEQYGQIITAPLTGGMNSMQISDIDINLDGINDAFVFDRGAWLTIPFLKDAANNYTYAPEYQNIFPAMEDWALLRDYNCDNIPDIFTYYIGSTKVYKGVIAGGELSYELEKQQLEYADATGGTTAVYTSRTDISSFDDLDNDGDLDVLSFSVSGSTIRFYKNISVESGFGCDSLIYELNQFCWGDLYEGFGCGGGTLHVVCKGEADNVAIATRELHIGSTILTLDMDGDEDKDAILGDNSCRSLVYYRNDGDVEYAEMGYKDTVFPNFDVSFEMIIFPATFLIDADNDGDKDLIATTNDDMQGLNTQNIWMYENLNATDTFDFVFNTDTFLTSEMIDAGAHSKPVYFDYNNDDLLDIVIGVGTTYGKDEVFKEGLYLYKNTGSLSSPAFELITTDFTDLDMYDINHLAPSFADIDNDGDEDMFCGQVDGTIIFLENLSGPTGEANFASAIFSYNAIDVGGFSAPCFIDIDLDDKLDMVVGEQNGNLNYYHNTGTITEPAFTLESEMWGGVDVRKTGFITGYSMPFMYRNENDSLYLLVGSFGGLIHEYNEIEDALLGEFYEVDSNFLNWNSGTYTTINGSDLNNDGEMEFLCGNLRGGLQIFERDFNVAIENAFLSDRISLFPNPVSDQLNIQIQTSKNINGDLKIFTSTGELIYTQKINNNSTIINLKGSIIPGMYLISVSGEAFHVSSVFIKM